jgi:hypothetical protein
MTADILGFTVCISDYSQQSSKAFRGIIRDLDIVLYSNIIYTVGRISKD